MRTAAGSDFAAVVLGLDSHGLAVARSLADAGVDVYALKRDPRLPGASTNRVRRIDYVHSFEADDLFEALRRLRPHLARYRRVALLCNNDRQVESIGARSNEIQEPYAISWSHCAGLVLQLQRKDALESFTRARGLLYPRSLTFDRSTPTDPANDFQFPLILKPIRPLSSFKTLLARDLSELGALLAAHTPQGPILAQEFIPGDDRQIYFGVLMLDHGRVLHGLTGRKISSYPPAQGQAIVAETHESEEVLELTRRFFAGTDLSGPAALELKRDPYGRYWVIEPTIGRTEFNVQLCISAGFNVPLMDFQLACGLPVTIPGPTRPCVWYDTERDPAAWLRLCWDQHSLRPYGKLQVFPYLGFHDWLPLARAMRQLGGKAAKRLLQWSRGGLNAWERWPRFRR